MVNINRYNKQQQPKLFGTLKGRKKKNTLQTELKEVCGSQHPAYRSNRQQLFHRNKPQERAELHCLYPQNHIPVQPTGQYEA